MTNILKINGTIISEKQYSNDVTVETVQDFFESVKEDEAIEVHINSYGGEISTGLAIYRLIKTHMGNVKVHINGFACSIASVIAFAGDELIVNDSSVMMIHLPYIATVGNKIELANTIQALETIEETILNIYTDNLKYESDRSKIKNFMYEEKWFTTDEIEEYFKVTNHADINNYTTRFQQKIYSENYKNKVLKRLKNKADKLQREKIGNNLLKQFTRGAK